jgi:hypothetical protein
MPDHDLIGFAEVLGQSGEIKREEMPISGSQYTNSGSQQKITHLNNGFAVTNVVRFPARTMKG